MPAVRISAASKSSAELHPWASMIMVEDLALQSGTIGTVTQSQSQFSLTHGSYQAAPALASPATGMAAVTMPALAVSAASTSMPCTEAFCSFADTCWHFLMFCTRVTCPVKRQ